jgi:hypothetical protein
MYLVETHNNGVTVITGTIRLNGISYTVIDPGSLTLSQVEQLLTHPYGGPR